MIGDHRWRKESGYLEPAVTVRRTHHGNLDAHVAQSSDAICPVSFDWGAPLELEAKLGIAEKSLIDTVVHCSGSSSALERAVEVGGVRAFCELAAPFLKKDLDACFAAVRELGQDVGGLGQVATRGPFDFSSGHDVPNQER